MASNTKRSNRKKRILTATLYCYVEPKVAKVAHLQGAPGKWGSFSNYVNYLIAQANGLKDAVARSRVTAKESSTPALARPTSFAKKKVKRVKTKTTVKRQVTATKRHLGKVIKLARRVGAEVRTIQREAKAA